MIAQILYVNRAKLDIIKIKINVINAHTHAYPVISALLSVIVAKILTIWKKIPV
jgi:hypothetical protein